ncbi:Target of RNAIII-activating protein, partial [Acinetobacter baumannii]|nr:Target of RNAIII-activating protein [Acinetobacter baumannii]
ASYEVWTETGEYKQFFEPLFDLNPTSVQNIFEGRSYVTTYQAAETE